MGLEFRILVIVIWNFYSSNPPADCRKGGKTIEAHSGASAKPGPLSPDSLLSLAEILDTLDILVHFKYRHRVGRRITTPVIENQKFRSGFWRSYLYS